MKYFYFLLCFALSSTAFGDATSGSQSGAISGAASQAGAIGFIDQSNTVVKAADLGDRVPGVFGAGVASGTNPCLVSTSGGASGSGFGFNIGASYEDTECTVRESLRLMAAISQSAETANQLLLRGIACQSAVYWDSFEAVYNETGDERYYCANPRPEEGRVVMRPIHQPVKALRDTDPAPVATAIEPEGDLWADLGY